MKMKRLASASLPVAAILAALALSSCNEKDNFDLADTNGDGTITHREFERYMLEAIYSTADADRNRDVTFGEWKAANPDAEASKFSAPDTDRSGGVSPDELRNHFIEQGTLTELFKKIDITGNGRLTREEVEAFQRKVIAQSGSTELQKLSRAAAE